MSQKAKRAAAAKRAAQQQSSQQRMMIGGGVILTAIVVVLAIIVLKGPQTTPVQAQDSSSQAQPQNASAAGTGVIVDYPIQGQTHIPEGSPHPQYNSNPPTSGWHYATPADWGVYDEVLPDETVVHNLEHGGIWISYRDPGDTATSSALKTIMSGFKDHVILTVRPANDSLIAVAAWGHLLKLDKVDTQAIINFISLYIYKGPENV